MQKIEEQLNCPICLDTYTNPKLLQCFHVYCKECLVHLVARDQRGKLSLTCPNCRQVTPVPDTGVSGLKSAFHINHLLEIMEEHKKEKDTTKSSHCTEHVDEELKLYCETCSEVICYKCVITKWGRHHSHDYESISDAFEKYKEEVSAFVKPMGKQLTRIDQALTDWETCSAEIDIRQDLVKANIESTVRELYIVLEARKTKLLNQLQEISDSKHKSLSVQKDKLETTKAQLHSCEGFVRQSIKTECQSEVLKMRKTIVHQAKELTKEFPPSLLKPCTEPDLNYSAATTVLQQYSSIVKCHATGKGLETATVGEKSTATVQIVSWDGRSCLEPIESLECELESMLTGARVRGEVKERERGKYRISYQPVTKGRNLLHVTLGGLNIRGSPFDVSVASPIEDLGVPIQIFRDLEYPQGVAFNQAGEIIISAGNRVTVLSPNGTKLRSFGTRGSGPGQFLAPVGVTVDDEDNILVADSKNHRIQKFTNDGQFLASMGTKGTGPLQFKDPMDVAFNTHNKKVYVVDSWNHRIQILNSDLTISNIIEKHGSKSEKFAYPCGVTCDSTGNVYVADSANNCIEVFTASMILQAKFGHWNWPVGIAVDSRGMVFVSEHKKHCISVFTTGGRLVKSFGQQGTKPGELNGPMWLAVDDCGVLCVCDRDNGCVKVY